MPIRRLVLFLFVALGAVFAFFLFTQPDLQLYMKNLLLEFGLVGFFLFSVVFNVLVIPFPYDPFLLAMLWAGEGALPVFATALGATVVASALAYGLGHSFSHYTGRWFEGEKSKKLLKKLDSHGLTVLAASAIIPMPLSLLTWLSGLLKKKLWQVVLIVLITRGARIGLVVYLLQ